MILTIFIMLENFLGILKVKDIHGLAEIMAGLLLAVALSGAELGVIVGWYGYSFGVDSNRKADIEQRLGRGDESAEWDAIQYNRTLRWSDNYFVRFELRPKSDYIDLKYYDVRGEL